LTKEQNERERERENEISLGCNFNNFFPYLLEMAVSALPPCELVMNDYKELSSPLIVGENDDDDDDDDGAPRLIAFYCRKADLLFSSTHSLE
jgi:hypothetical protein